MILTCIRSVGDRAVRIRIPVADRSIIFTLVDPFGTNAVLGVQFLSGSI